MIADEYKRQGRRDQLAEDGQADPEIPFGSFAAFAFPASTIWLNFASSIVAVSPCCYVKLKGAYGAGAIACKQDLSRTQNIFCLRLHCLRAILVV